MLDSVVDLIVEGVVLAAGHSSRACGWKMGFMIGGLTIIERCVLGMIEYCSRIFVIGGNRFDLLQAVLLRHKYPMVELIYNREYETGMFSSVLKGFRQVRAPRFFYTPGDYPLVSSEVYQLLLKEEGEINIPSYRGVTGHPVLFQTRVIKDLLGAPNKYGNLREFAATRRCKIIEVSDPGIVMDIDTGSDYRRAVRYFNNHQ